MESSKSFPVKVLNAGMVISTAMMAISRAINVRISDSPRNCDTSLAFDTPMAFLIPISLALLLEVAVDRFIKLIPAMIRIRMAATRNT